MRITNVLLALIAALLAVIAIRQPPQQVAAAPPVQYLYEEVPTALGSQAHLILTSYMNKRAKEGWKLHSFTISDNSLVWER